MERKSEAAHVAVLDALAQEIRRVDGTHSLGAGALAEALWPFIAALTAGPQAAPEVSPAYVKGGRMDPCDTCGARAGELHHEDCADMRRLASPQVQGGEAVAWQYRTPKLLSDGWHPWQQCDRELFDELTEHGSYAGRPVQVRALCATPQRAPGVTEEMARCPLCGVSGLHACTGQPIKPWTEQDKRDLVAAMQRIEERERAAPVSAVGVDDCAKCGKSNRLNCNDECWNCGAALICRCHTDDQRRYCADREKCSRAYALSAAAQDQGEGNGA
jgi:hypothetical protein